MLKKVLMGIFGAVVALAIGSAGAVFVSELQVPENVIRAGDVTLSSEPTSSAIVIDPIAPGETVTRTMMLRNDGSLLADVTITPSKKAGITDFFQALHVKVTSNGQDLYNGSLANMRADRLRLDPGEVVPVNFAVTLPSGADQDLSGDYVRFTLCLNATQVD